MSVGCIKRLQTELKNFKLNPSTNVDASPSEDDILKWYYIIDGPVDTPYEGGEYYGYVTFPKEYPFKAPHIAMSTPNGRFETNSNICMSMTAWHPESWQPSWQCATILQGLASFMAEESSAVATIKKTKKERETFAKNSREWNLKNFKQFANLFPERYAKAKKYVENGGKLPTTEEEKNKDSYYYVDPSKVKDPVVAESIRKANEAHREKEAASKAKAAAAELEKESGQRRQRDDSNNNGSSSVPQNNSTAQQKNNKNAEVIELE